MATGTKTRPDSDQDSRYNAGEQYANDLVDREKSSGRQAEIDRLNDSFYGGSADSRAEDRNIQKAREAEERGSSPEFENNVTQKPAKSRRRALLKKYGPTAALGGGGIGILGILAFSSPLSFVLSVLVGMPNQAVEFNDTRSPILKTRSINTFRHMTQETTPDCVGKQTIPCKSKRVSNKTLSDLSNRGLVAYFGDVKFDGTKTGYPDRNPTHWEIDGERRVTAAQLANELGQKGNRTVAAKVFGIKGAVNLTVKAWRGNHMSNKWYRPAGIRLNGGFADGNNRTLSATERLAAFQQKLQASMPGAAQAETIKQNVRQKVEKHMGKARKGGPTYMVAVGGCVALKAPMYIATGVAAYELTKLSPIAMNVIMSPGSLLQAGGGNVGPGITSTDVDVIMSGLTEKTPNAQGKMTSALDSPYLMAALGINKSRLPPNKFAPGYSVISNSAVQQAMKAEAASRDGCNVIMSPAAMWSAVAVDSALTLLLSATIIGGIIKIAVSWTASIIIGEIAQKAVASLADDVIEGIANDETIEKATGEEFGDVLGGSISTFFAAGGMAGGHPVMTQAQLQQFEVLRQESIQFDRELAQASLSPFDLSSKYTLMGSFYHQLQQISLANGHMDLHLPSILASTLAIPSQLQSVASANTGPGTLERCNYADEFFLSTGDPNTTPAINNVGVPCTGFVSDMSFDRALYILEDEGWVDPEAESTLNNLTLDDLMPSGTEDGYNGIGYIKEDTPLYEFYNTCSNPTNGEYLMNSTGCILRSASQVEETLNPASSSCPNNNGDEVEGECRAPSTLEGGADGQLEELGIKNADAYEAIAVFINDWQLTQIINGEDDGQGGALAPTATPGTTIVDGTDQELAQTILDNSDITISPRYEYQIENYANGNTSCYLDSDLLKLIATLGETRSIYITSINRACTGSTAGSGRASLHWQGKAVDIGSVNDVASTGGRGPDIAIYNDAMKILPDRRLGLGQKQCRPPGAVNIPAGNRSYEHTDTCHHIHIGIAG